MAFLAPILSAAIPALGGIFGNRPQQSTQGGTSQTNQNSLSLPVMTPQQGGLFNPLADAFLKQLSQGTDLTGYHAQQAQQIAGNTDIAKRQAIENLASRGITTGAAPAAALTGVENQGFAQQTQLNQQIPLLQQELFSNLANIGTNLFARLPSGSNTTGGTNTAQQGQVTQPGNILGGLFGNLDPTSLMNAINAIGGLFGPSGASQFYG